MAIKELVHRVGFDASRNLTNYFTRASKLVLDKAFLENASGNDGHIQDFIGRTKKGGNGQGFAWTQGHFLDYE
jgi:hypothetical protein